MIEAFDCFRTQAYIAGQWVDALDGSTFEVLNPVDDSVIAEVANCGSKETEQAITAAHNSLIPWSSKPAKEKAGLMRAWFETIVANAETLASLLTLEQGKPLAEARTEINYGASYIEWFSEETKRIYGDVIPAPGADKRILTIKQPVGVVACITPWNFPTAMLARKIAPALAAGCTVVCKPANEGGQHHVRHHEEQFQQWGHPVRRLDLKQQCDCCNQKCVVCKRREKLRRHDGVKAGFHSTVN